MADEHDLRKAMLNGAKRERIIFAATPETKEALEVLAQEQCVSVSALITRLVIDEALRNAEIVAKEAVQHV